MKICVVTATRAEYGLLKPLIDKLRVHTAFDLQLLVTGAHLSPEFGFTYKQIEQDGLDIDAKVEMLLSSDTAEGISKSMGLGMIGYADAFSQLVPDIILILGDRYEMLSVACSASIFKIPIIHLHGGEITEGAYDDNIRHAITKLSMLHFTSTEEYRQRVIQMGEYPDYVFDVGAIGLDNIRNLRLLTRQELEEDLGIQFKKYNYQVTFHPETLADKSSESQFKTLLKVIDKQEDSYFIFTKSNADTDGRIINQLINEFVAKNLEKASAFTSLGSLRFLSLVKVCDALVGNSSSGIIEAPSLHTATINIGDRQKGRIQAESVLNCKVEEGSIADCFDKVKDKIFRDRLSSVTNPYGMGDTTEKIIEVLKNMDFRLLKTKSFYNIKTI